MSETDTQEPDQQDEATETEAETKTQEPDHKAEAEKWKALARKNEQQAKANATAAQELEKIRESQKTAEQKAAEKATAAEKDAADARAEAIRLRVAMKHGLSEEDLDLLGTGDEEQIEARAKRLAELSAAKNGDEPRRRPQERLRSGVAPGTEPDEDTEPGLPRLMQAYSQK